MPDYIQGIQRTGFVLEYKISKELKDRGWNIISNKFYEDDLAETVREIDILAYKASTAEEIFIFTVLLISCKKNEQNVWALISREIELDDPNSNWWPTHIWTNDIATKKELESENFNKEYYKFLSDEKKVLIMQFPEVDVFAFQELNKNNGSPQNDKNIFSSLTTLMKAQAYEMGALNNRIKFKAIYQFNLLSVIQSDLIRIHIQHANSMLTQKSVETEQLVARYIIRKQQQFFRIRFLKADVFPNYLKSYDLLHESNIDFFINRRNAFLVDSIKDHSKVKQLLPEFLNQIAPHIYEASGYHLNEEEIKKNLFIVWEDSKNYLRIFVTKDEKVCNRLNSDELLLSETRKGLLKVFKFEGSFEYETDELPF